MTCHSDLRRLRQVMAHRTGALAQKCAAPSLAPIGTGALAHAEFCLTLSASPTPRYGHGDTGVSNPALRLFGYEIEIVLALAQRVSVAIRARRRAKKAYKTAPLTVHQNICKSFQYDGRITRRSDTAERVQKPRNPSSTKGLAAPHSTLLPLGTQSRHLPTPTHGRTALPVRSANLGECHRSTQPKEFLT